MKIKDLMKKPIVVEKDLLLSDAAKLMTKYSISSLIIEKDGKVAGLLTYKDIVRYFGEPKKVFEVMNKEVFTLKDSDKVQKVVEAAKDKGIGIFPITDSKGKLVGVLDSNDLLKVWDSEDFLIE